MNSNISSSQEVHLQVHPVPLQERNAVGNKGHVGWLRSSCHKVLRMALVSMPIMGGCAQKDEPVVVDHAKAHEMYLQSEFPRDKPRILEGDIIGGHGENLLGKYAHLLHLTEAEKAEIMRKHHRRNALGYRSLILSGNLGEDEKFVTALLEELRLARLTQEDIDFTKENLEEARILGHCQGAEIRRHGILHPLNSEDREFAIARFREHLEVLGFGPGIFGLTDDLEEAPHLADRRWAEYYRDVLVGNPSDTENVRTHFPKMQEKLMSIDQAPKHLGLCARMMERLRVRL